MSKNMTKLKLDTYNTLFGDDEFKELKGKGSEVVDIPLIKMHSFKGHPYRVLDDEAMYELANSIKQEGVIYPGLVRPDEDGYEIIAGHRRHRGSELAGMNTMPCIVLDISHKEAVRIMVYTNIQRPHILISERAFAFRLDMENAKIERGSGRTDSWLAEQAGLGRSTIQRYIRLTYLIKGFLDLVDINNIGITTGETLSYLKTEEQENVFNFMTANGINRVSSDQADTLKDLSQNDKWQQQLIENIFKIERKGTAKVILKAKTLIRYFPKGYSQQEMEEVIFDLLDKWAEREYGNKEEENEE